MEGQADYIVSGDKELLDLGEYEGIKIIRAREFVNILDEIDYDQQTVSAQSEKD